MNSMAKVGQRIRGGKGLGPPELRQGIVTAVNLGTLTCTLQMSGDDPDDPAPRAGVPVLGTLFPMAGEAVWYWQNGTDRAIHGPVDSKIPSLEATYVSGTAQTLATDGAALIFDNNVRISHSSMHNESTNRTRLIAPRPGRYLIIGNVGTTPQPAGPFDGWITVNGSGNYGWNRDSSSTASNNYRQVLAEIWMDTNDYAEVWFGNSAGSVTTIQARQRVTMRYTGPI